MVRSNHTHRDSCGARVSDRRRVRRRSDLRQRALTDNKRGFYTSFIQVTAILGLFVSLLVILATQFAMNKEDFANWGWRVPFLFL